MHAECQDVVVAGAGLAGMFAALWLSRSKRVLLVCSGESGGSHIAAGLVNPRAGRRARLIWHGEEAIDDFAATIDLASAHQHYSATGIVRPALDASHAETLKPKGQWLSPDAATARFPEVRAPFGALITRGGVADTRGLLSSAHSALVAAGSGMVCGVRVTGWDTWSRTISVHLDSGEQVRTRVLILALGYGYRHFGMLRRLNLHAVKGQMLQVQPPAHTTLAHPVCGGGYVVPQSDRWTLGTTYERGFKTQLPTRQGQQKILDLARNLVPQVDGLAVLGRNAAIRVGVPGTRLPMVGPLSANVWVLTGMGSKGLLMSAHIARQLKDWMRAPDQIPGALRVR